MISTYDFFIRKFFNLIILFNYDTDLHGMSCHALNYIKLMSYFIYNQFSKYYDIFIYI